ncbi:MAG: ROK family protein [Terrimicrobiaceae bacterium]
MHVWGLDLGGTKIEGAIFDPASPNTPVARLRLPTESAKGYDHVLGQIARVVAALEEQSGAACPPQIGAGTPGAIEPSTGKIKNSNTRCLNGRPFRDDLGRLLGSRVHCANDANCFALAEATLGAAKGENVVVGLILGTGVGGGLVVGGRLIQGVHGIAGEWGHNPLCGEQSPCYCGRKGCVETVIAGPSLERFYHERSGNSLSLRQIAAREGDPHAAATLARLQQKFGEAVAALINILDPDAIVIGGGVGNLSLLYDEQTRGEILKHTFNAGLKTKILKPVLGDSAGVFGAAMLTHESAQ